MTCSTNLFSQGVQHLAGLSVSSQGRFADEEGAALPTPGTAAAPDTAAEHAIDKGEAAPTSSARDVVDRNTPSHTEAAPLGAELPEQPNSLAATSQAAQAPGLDSLTNEEAARVSSSMPADDVQLKDEAPGRGSASVPAAQLDESASPEPGAQQALAAMAARSARWRAARWEGCGGPAANANGDAGATGEAHTRGVAISSAGARQHAGSAPAAVRSADASASGAQLGRGAVGASAGARRPAWEPAAGGRRSCVTSV